MTGASFNVDLEVEAAIAGLNAFLRRLDPEDMLDEVGAVAEDGARARLLDDKRAPDGAPWAPWSPAYARRRGGRGSLLRRDGHLADSITREVDRDGVSIGSNRVYAAIHQFGGPVGKSGAGEMPARPYLGISDDERDDIGEIVSAWLDDAGDAAERAARS